VEDHPAQSEGWSFALVGPPSGHEHVERLGQLVHGDRGPVQFQFGKDRFVHGLAQGWPGLPVQLLWLVEQVECQPKHLASSLKLRVQPLDVAADARPIVADGYELLPDFLLG
jgi:hypothetical protein